MGEGTGTRGEELLCREWGEGASEKRAFPSHKQTQRTILLTRSKTFASYDKDSLTQTSSPADSLWLTCVSPSSAAFTFLHRGLLFEEKEEEEVRRQKRKKRDGMMEDEEGRRKAVYIKSEGKIK